MALLGFDATTVQPDTGQLDPIPAGWYIVSMDESDVKPTNDGLGARLAVRFVVLDGQYAGRKIYSGFNIRNANPVAQEIAFKQLSALAHAVGVLNVQDSAQLHNIPLKVRVKIKPPKDGYEAQNEITAYKNINEDVGGATASTAPVPGAPSAPSIPAAPSAPPAAPAAPTQAGFTPGAQPWQQPAAPVAPGAPPAFNAPPAPAAPPAAPPVAPAAPAFPPEGWTAHPTAAGYYYMGNEVLTEAELRQRVAPSAPAVPAAPAAPPAVPDPAATAAAVVPPWQKQPG